MTPPGGGAERCHSRAHSAGGADAEPPLRSWPWRHSQGQGIAGPWRAHTQAKRQAEGRAATPGTGCGAGELRCPPKCAGGRPTQAPVTRKGNRGRKDGVSQPGRRGRQPAYRPRRRGWKRARYYPEFIRLAQETGGSGEKQERGVGGGQTTQGPQTHSLGPRCSPERTSKI